MGMRRKLSQVLGHSLDRVTVGESTRSELQSVASETQTSSGAVITKFEDGTTVITTPDFAVHIKHPDGSRESIGPDGTRLIADSSGNTVAIGADGSSLTYLYSDGTSFPGDRLDWPTAASKSNPQPDGTIMSVDGAGNTRYADGTGFEMIATGDAIWAKDKVGNIEVRSFENGITWRENADGSSSITDSQGKVIERTDIDGSRWIRDASSEKMLYAGRPHVQWTSPDKQTTISEIHGNLFKTSPEGYYIKIGDGEWTVVNEAGFRSSKSDSLELQHIRETPHHPHQDDLIYADTLSGFTKAFMEAYVELAMDLTPYLGAAKGFIESATGESLITGEEVSPLQRALNLLPAISMLSKGTAVAGAVLALDKGPAAEWANDAWKIHKLAEAADRADDAAGVWEIITEQTLINEITIAGVPVFKEVNSWPNRAFEVIFDVDRGIVHGDKTEAVRENGGKAEDAAITPVEESQLGREPADEGAAKDKEAIEHLHQEADDGAVSTAEDQKLHDAARDDGAVCVADRELGGHAPDDGGVCVADLELGDGAPEPEPEPDPEPEPEPPPSLPVAPETPPTPEPEPGEAPHQGAQ